MKKVVIGLALVAVLLLLVGCLDYKAYNVTKQPAGKDTSIIQSEIAEIEKQIAEQEKKDIANASASITSITEEKKEVEGEVVLPQLGEEKKAEEALEANLQTVSVKESQLVKLKLSLTDPDNDEVKYTFSKPLNEKGEWKTSYGDAGEYVVTVTATDGKLSTEKKLKVIVERVNVPPTVDGIKDLVVKEGDLVKFEPLVNDPNKDPVTVTISEPLSSGTWTTDYKSSGEYVIKVAASDGELKTEKSFKLTVNDVNLVPKVSNLQDLTVKEGQLIKLEPVVEDGDADQGGELKITYSKPFSSDGTWTPNFTEHGIYPINVTVDDGRGGVVSTKIKVTVEDVNMPPSINNITLEIK